MKSSILTAAVLLGLASSVCLAQAPVLKAKTAGKTAVKAPAKQWTLSKTPDGQPDFQGVWNYGTLTPLERPAELAGKATFTEAEAKEFAKRTQQQVSTDRRDGGAEADVGRSYNEFWRDRGTVKAGRTSLIMDPPDGKIPALTPDAKRMEDARVKTRSGPPSGPEDRNTWERCLTRGVPMFPSSYNNNFQIVQTPGYVTIIVEMVHDARIIPLDGRPHLPPNMRSWMGDSRGHWEGNTLVVDTTNFNDQVSFRGSTENLHVIERFTRTDADTLDYQFTMDDPKAFTRPWTAVIPASRTDEPIFEYACHEGNYALGGMLSGAREAEKKAAAAARRPSN